MDYKFTNNEDYKRFELEVNGSRAIAEYLISPQGVVFMTKTEVPNSLTDQEIIPLLLENSFENIKQNDKVIFPMCPIVKAYIDQHPEWSALVE